MPVCCGRRCVVTQRLAQNLMGLLSSSLEKKTVICGNKTYKCTEIDCVIFLIIFFGKQFQGYPKVVVFIF